MKKLSIMLLSTVFLLSLTTGCAKNAQPVSKSDFVLDTVATITVYDGSDESIIDDTYNECRRYENLISATVSGSDVYRINEAHGAPVEVSDETIEIINEALKFSKLTDGAFDITIYPVSKLWDFRTGKGRVPESGAISNALKHVDYHNIIVEGNTVTLKDPQAEIDPGAIGKGYIADKLKEYMVSRGVTSAIINLGGNVITIGKNVKTGNAFKIGIKKPFTETNEIITSVDSIDNAVVSSGSYERYFVQDGVIYFHILDPKTGYPVRSGLSGVSVITANSLDGDALSTSLFALGAEKGQQLVDELSGKIDIKAIFVDEEGKIISN